MEIAIKPKQDTAPLLSSKKEGSSGGRLPRVPKEEYDSRMFRISRALHLSNKISSALAAMFHGQTLSLSGGFRNSSSTNAKNVIDSPPSIVEASASSYSQIHCPGITFNYAEKERMSDETSYRIFPPVRISLCNKAMTISFSQCQNSLLFSTQSFLRLKSIRIITRLRIRTRGILIYIHIFF